MRALPIVLAAASLLGIGCGSQSPSTGGGSTAPPMGSPPPAGPPPAGTAAPDPRVPPANGALNPDGAYAPCAGKTCGEPCTVCSPAATDCMETMVVKQCNAQGQCSTDPVDCPK